MFKSLVWVIAISSSLLLASSNANAVAVATPLGNDTFALDVTDGGTATFTSTGHFFNTAPNGSRGYSFYLYINIFFDDRDATQRIVRFIEEYEADGTPLLVSKTFELQLTDDVKSITFLPAHMQGLASASVEFDGGLAPAVPEPSTWAMLLIGFAGITFISYRRHRVTSSAA